jgi:preprotein translocase subunit YajC
MNSLIPDAMAQAAGGATPQSGLPMFVMMGLFVVIFYFLLIRPQQKKQKEHQAILSKLAAGDEIVTAGGIVGRIIEIGETFITLEVADNVRLKVQRFQVTTLVPKGTLKGA